MWDVATLTKSFINLLYFLMLEVLRIYCCSNIMKMDEELKKHVLKTGTSILGIVCKDGIVMAGDRQVTGGQSIIMDKNYQKVFQINDYLVASYTGGVSDAQFLNKIVAAELRLKQLRSKSRPSIKEAANLFAMLTFKNIRQFSNIRALLPHSNQPTRLPTWRSPRFVPYPAFPISGFAQYPDFRPHSPRTASASW